jgi:hypothetical protein
MTTIIVDKVGKRVYTDSRDTIGPTTISIFGKVIYTKGKSTHIDNFCKVFHRTRGRLITGSGDAGEIEAFRDYLTGLRKKRPPLEGSTVYDITTEPVLKVLCYEGTGVTDVTEGGTHQVCGSGGAYAEGVLWSRKLSPEDSSRKAMAAAIGLDPYTGGDIVEYDISGRWFDDDKC